MIENNIACNSAIQQQLDQKKNITMFWILIDVIVP